jgi:hypothetical protein
MRSLRESTTVHFTEVFLNASLHSLSDVDLKSLALALTEDPDVGEDVPNCPGLRTLERYAIASGKSYNVWYLTFSDTPHIEVVAYSDSGSHDRLTNVPTKLLWKVVRIGLILRSAYRAVRIGVDHLEHWF